MKKVLVYFAIVSMTLIGFLGCSIFGNSSNLASPVLDSVSSPIQKNGPANLNIQISLPGANKGHPLATIRGSSNPTVTIKLVIAYPGNQNQSYDTVIKRASVTNSSASFTFSHIPDRPTMVLLSIDQGSIQGYSRFHGAKDLKPGSNTIVISPVGSRTSADIIATVFQEMLHTPDIIKNAPSQFVSIIESSINSSDLKLPQIYSETFNSSLAQMSPSTVTKLVNVPSSGSVKAYVGADPNPKWEQKLSNIFTATGPQELQSGAEISRILRYVVGTFGLIGFTDTAHNYSVVGKIDATNGSLLNYVIFHGTLTQISLLNDNSLIVSGFHKALNEPILFRWTGTSNSRISDDGSGNTGISWVNLFTDNHATTTIPEPTINCIQDFENGYLIVSVDNPANESLQNWEISLDTGGRTLLNPNLVPNKFPSIELLAPVNNASYSLGMPITLNASATDSDGLIASITFIANDTEIAVATSSPYNYVWYPDSIGTYSLIAKATDNKGAESLSVPVQITVYNSNPSIISLSPADDETNVSNYLDYLTIQFDRPVSVVSSGAISLIRKSDNSVALSKLCSDFDSNVSSETVFKYKIDGTLAKLADYYVQIASDTFSDKLNNKFTGIDDQVTWNFKTWELNPPVISSMQPAPGDTNVPLNATFTATFNRAIKAGTGSIILKDVTDMHEIASISVTSPKVTFSNDTVSFSFNGLLEPNKEYNIEIPYLSISGERGQLSQGISQPGIWHFKTSSATDTFKPKIVTLIPASGSTLVPGNLKPSFIFDEAIARGSEGKIIIQDSASGFFEEFPAADSRLQIDDKKVTIGYLSNFPAGANLKLSIEPNTFVDSSGNGFSGIATTSPWTFSIATSADTTPPQIASQHPASGATGISYKSAIWVTFDKPIASGSVSQSALTVTNQGVTVNGSVSLEDDGKSIMFKPDSDFATNTTMLVTLSSSTSDLYGNNLASDVIFSFSTFSAYTEQLSWHLTKINAPEAWALGAKGQGVKVGVVDTGVDSDHPDLMNNIGTGIDVVNNDDNPEDDNGHGTQVSGIIAASGNNGNALGVAPEATIIPIKAADSSGHFTFAGEIAAVDWAISNGIKIVNMSFGANGEGVAISYDATDPRHEIIKQGVDEGVCFIGSAGNVSNNFSSIPAGEPGILSVYSTTDADARTSFSNYGHFVDIGAPGLDLKTTVMGGGTDVVDGTSMSAAVVTGVVALLKSVHPNWTPEQLVQAILRTSADLGSAGYDYEFSAGRIDAAAAIAFQAPQSVIRSNKKLSRNLNEKLDLSTLSEKSYVPGELLLVCNKDTNLSEILAETNTSQTRIKVLDQIARRGYYHIRVPVGEEIQIIKSLLKSKKVKACGLNYISSIK